MAATWGATRPGARWPPRSPERSSKPRFGGREGTMAEVETDVELGQRYRLVKRIAVGGMGSVWEAEDTVLHRRVAVKLLSDALSADRRFADRFRREAQAAAPLSHPNIASVFDYGEDDGHQFIVMELVDG